MVTQVGAITSGVADEAVCLMTHHKDASSTYLREFPDWASEHIKAKNHPVSATKIRNKLFRRTIRSEVWDGILTPAVRGCIQTWMQEEPELFAELCEEHEKDARLQRSMA